MQGLLGVPIDFGYVYDHSAVSDQGNCESVQYLNELVSVAARVRLDVHELCRAQMAHDPLVVRLEGVYAGSLCIWRLVGGGSCVLLVNIEWKA